MLYIVRYLNRDAAYIKAVALQILTHETPNTDSGICCCLFNQ
jgi:hypothetical protein